jgi:hypothetical protein
VRLPAIDVRKAKELIAASWRLRGPRKLVESVGVPHAKSRKPPPKRKV